MKTILITGTSGFIGSHLVQKLVKDFKIISLSRSDLNSQKIIQQSTKGVSTIIHLAAQKYNTNDLNQMRKVNVGITKNLLRFAGSAHFIYISTWLAKYPDKTGLYGLTKNEAEEQVKKGGLNYTILRLPHIYSQKPHNRFIAKYLLPIYLKVRYGVRPIYQPISVEEVCLSIKKVIYQKKFYRKSFYVVNKKTFNPFT